MWQCETRYNVIMFCFACCAAMNRIIPWKIGIGGCQSAGVQRIVLCRAFRTQWSTCSMTQLTCMKTTTSPSACCTIHTFAPGPSVQRLWQGFVSGSLWSYFWDNSKTDTKERPESQIWNAIQVVVSQSNVYVLAAGHLLLWVTLSAV